MESADRYRQRPRAFGCPAPRKSVEPIERVPVGCAPIVCWIGSSARQAHVVQRGWEHGVGQHREPAVRIPGQSGVRAVAEWRNVRRTRPCSSIADQTATVRRPCRTEALSAEAETVGLTRTVRSRTCPATENRSFRYRALAVLKPRIERNSKPRLFNMMNVNCRCLPSFIRTLLGSDWFHQSRRLMTKFLVSHLGTRLRWCGTMRTGGISAIGQNTQAEFPGTTGCWRNRR